MRQRKVLHAEPAVVGQPLLRRVAAVDMFPKPKEDYQQAQTPVGFVLSILTASVLVLLLLWEVFIYASGKNAYRTDLAVDKSRVGDMKVNFDVSLPRTPCHKLSVDVLDVSGTRRFNVTQSLFKAPLTAAGAVAYKGDFYLPVTDSSESTYVPELDPGAPEYCGTCVLKADWSTLVDAGEKKRGEVNGRCCNTCAAVQAMYEEIGLPPPSINRVPQCLYEIAVENPGCRVKGLVDVVKTSGSLVLGPRLGSGGRYLITDVLAFDSSHVIHSFTIGDERVPRFSRRGVVQPLSGHSFSSREFSEVRYFLKVIPTTYNTRRKPQINATTYEYSVQWSQRSVTVGLAGAIPVVVFGFEINPIQLNNYLMRQPLTHFLVQLCGIIGGLFVILGLVDGVVSRVVMCFA